MADEIKVWGDGRHGLWSFGASVDIPDEFVEMPTGNSFLTRKVKELARTVYVRMKKNKRGGYSRPIGVLAPKEVIEAAKAKAQRTDEARSKQRRVSARQREKKEARLRAEVKARILKMYPNMPEQEAGWIAEHAFEVGSGRVGRSSSVDLEVKIELAVLAHIRHNHTSYDDLLNQGWEREVARLEIAGDVNRVVLRWKGENQPRESTNTTPATSQ